MFVSKIARLITTVFGLGYMPKAPGTFGALAAVPFIPVFAHPLWGAVTLLVVGAIGYWATVVHLRELEAGQVGVPASPGEKSHLDPSQIVIDEWLGQGLTYYVFLTIGRYSFLKQSALLVSEVHLSALFPCFVLFRLFDIWKPGPVGWIDRQLNGATGVIVDDLAAGVIAGVFLPSMCAILGVPIGCILVSTIALYVFAEKMRNRT